MALFLSLSSFYLHRAIVTDTSHTKKKISDFLNKLYPQKQVKSPYPVKKEKLRTGAVSSP
jgi:hypothetical protein